MSSDTIIIGNLTRAPELRFGKSGVAWATFSVAVNRGKDDKKETDFFECKAFGDLAEALAELPQGQRVMCKGAMRQERWEDKQSGQKRSKIVMSVFDAGPSWRFGNGPRKGAPGDAKAVLERGFGGVQDVSDEEPFLSRTDEALEVGVTGRGEVRSWR